MDIDSLRLEALKKAYADILLNTSKEATARIMVSERKALRFEQDLSATRDEALVKIVRMKQMMDSKITEAEIKSSTQRRKLEELEAQLYEAEQIVIDLRFELKEAQDELEKGKKKQSLNKFFLKKDVSSRGHKAHDIELNASDPITLPPFNFRPTITADNMKITPLLQESPNRGVAKYIEYIDLSSDSPPCQLAETYPPSSMLSCCERVSDSVYGEDMLEMTENGDKVRSEIAASTSGVVQIAPELEKSVLVKQDIGSSEGSGFPFCTMNLAMVDVPLENPNLEDAKTSEADNGASSQADSDRFLKYTFHRKRKKVPFSSPDQITSLENNSLKRVGEKQTGAPEPLESSVIDELSWDSRRLEQPEF